MVIPGLLRHVRSHMNTAAATISALSAAALFAASAALQTKALRIAGLSLANIPKPGWRRLAGTFTTPTWLAGTAVAGAALGLHALALYEGSLTLVQPLLVAVVVFALPANFAIGGTRITISEAGSAALLTGGLVSFYFIAHPIPPNQATTDHWQAGMAAGVAAVTTLAIAALAAHRTGRAAAALFGASAGICFAGVAALLKSVTSLLTQANSSLLSVWQLYALAATGAAGILMSQLAYRSGPLSAGVSAMNSVNTVVSVVIGITVFDEHIRIGPWSTTGEIIALGGVMAATTSLSWRADRRPAQGRSGPKFGETAGAGRSVLQRVRGSADAACRSASESSVIVANEESDALSTPISGDVDNDRTRDGRGSGRGRLGGSAVGPGLCR
jgi:hypothetical protein